MSRSAMRAILAGALFLAGALSATLFSRFVDQGSAGQSAQSGSLQIAGSESMRPIVAACAEDFMAGSPQADVIVKGGGSGEGISALLHGLIEIGMSSRALTQKERDYAAANNIELAVTPLALDGIAVVVHPSNTLTALDLEQLKSIYSGSSPSWGNLGGGNGEILVVARAPGSGTATLFDERVLDGAMAAAHRKLATNEAIVEEIAARPDAIGYADLGAVRKANGRVKTVAIRASSDSPAVAPVTETLQSDAYPLARTLYLISTAPPSDLAVAFIGHCLGPRGKVLIQRAGYVGVPASPS